MSVVLFYSLTNQVLSCDKENCEISSSSGLRSRYHCHDNEFWSSFRQRIVVVGQASVSHPRKVCAKKRQQQQQQQQQDVRYRNLISKYIDRLKDGRGLRSTFIGIP